MSTGVRAHLEHLLIYAGERVEKPVAERTRKVQEWGVLKSWQKNVRTPITFEHLLTHLSGIDYEWFREARERGLNPVSYTHLTLPTIYPV